MKSVRIQIFSGLHFPAFVLNREICSANIRIESKCRRMQTRKTPKMYNFYAVLGTHELINISLNFIINRRNLKGVLTKIVRRFKDRNLTRSRAEHEIIIWCFLERNGR